MASQTHLPFSFFQRPAAHYGTGRKADVMRADAPPWPTGNHGDLDKLVRATLDGLTEGGVWTDDKLVVELLARKRFAGSQPSGAAIEIESWGADDREE